MTEIWSKTEQDGAALLASQDTDVRRGVERLLTHLIKRYGSGYDRIKTLAIITAGLDEHFSLIDEEECA